MVTHFDLVKGMSPDYMHSALLGVSKLLLNLWIKDQHIDVDMVEERIKLIDVPTEICRKPRGIRELKQKGYNI